MNKGYIIKTENDQYKILEIYVGKKGNEYYEFDLHPSQNISDYELGEEVNFQYIMECINHYPFHCECRTTDVYAIIIKQLTLKDKIKLTIKSLKKYLSNHENW